MAIPSIHFSTPNKSTKKDQPEESGIELVTLVTLVKTITTSPITSSKPMSVTISSGSPSSKPAANVFTQAIVVKEPSASAPSAPTISASSSSPKTTSTVDFNEKSFELGRSEGQANITQIQEIYASVLSKIPDRNDPKIVNARNQMIKTIPVHILHQMAGIAEGAEVDFDDVLDVHLFLDLMAAQFGCSALATRSRSNVVEKVTATNHAESEEATAEPDSIERYQKLKKADISIKGLKEGLRQAANETTIQSIIFDPISGNIHLATGEGQAPFEQWSVIENPLGMIPSKDRRDEGVRLARNLDWPWLNLGPSTVVERIDHSTKHKYCVVGWPGFCGALSGMNEAGFCVVANQCGKESNPTGMPITILLRTLLENASTVDEAIDIIQKNPISCSMIFTVVDKHGSLCKIELNASKKTTDYELLGIHAED